MREQSSSVAGPDPLQFAQYLCKHKIHMKREQPRPSARRVCVRAKHLPCLLAQRRPAPPPRLSLLVPSLDGPDPRKRSAYHSRVQSYQAASEAAAPRCSSFVLRPADHQRTPARPSSDFSGAPFAQDHLEIALRVLEERPPSSRRCRCRSWERSGQDFARASRWRSGRAKEGRGGMGESRKSWFGEGGGGGRKARGGSTRAVELRSTGRVRSRVGCTEAERGRWED